MPGTTYTYELIADNGTLGSTYYLLSPIYGGVLSYTTTGPGSASLASTKLEVKKGRVAVPIKGSTALACAGGVLAITTRAKGHKVRCGRATFTVAADQKQTIHTSRLARALLRLQPPVGERGSTARRASRPETVRARALSMRRARATLHRRCRRTVSRRRTLR
jgi:hypothetical protein